MCEINKMAYSLCNTCSIGSHLMPVTRYRQY